MDEGPKPVTMPAFVVVADNLKDGVRVGSQIWGLAFDEDAAQTLQRALPVVFDARVVKMIGAVSILEDDDRSLHFMLSMKPIDLPKGISDGTTHDHGPGN